MTHPSIEELIAYVDGESEDAAEVSEHTEVCSSCANTLRRVRALESLLGERTSWDDFEEHSSRAPSNGLDAILSEELRAEREDAQSRRLCEVLQRIPVEMWAAEVASRPSEQSEGLIRALIEMAIARFDDLAQDALKILDVADAVTDTLGAVDAYFEHKSEIWKNRGNALRMIGDYDAALAAADVAVLVADESTTGGFAKAQAIYTGGTVLAKMGRYREGSDAAAIAEQAFREYGDARRQCHARMLQATCLTEQGFAEEALQVNLAVRNQLVALRDERTLAYVVQNIAVAHLLLHRPDQALLFAKEAEQAYRSLGVQSEVIRAQWTQAAALVMLDEQSSGLEDLYRVAKAFEDLGMSTDAGFVQLWITGAHLRRHEWEEAARNARQAADTFAAAGAKVHFHEALAYLRTAIANRTATPALAEYVRVFLEAPAERPFTPPAPAE
jgi:tetratricopeptide (TPR) repeat protein